MTDDAACWCGGKVGPRGFGVVGCLDSSFHKWDDRAPTGPVQRLYISGPMSGIAECNYPAFNKAAKELEALGYVVENPAATATGSSYREIIKEDVRALMLCDGLAMLEGWWTSNGARLEMHLAGVLQMPVRPIAAWSRLILEAEDHPCINCGNDLAMEGFLMCTDCLEGRAV